MKLPITLLALLLCFWCKAQSTTQWYCEKNANSNKLLSCLASEKYGVGETYTIQFEKDGKMSFKGNSFPTVLREQDCIVFHYPSVDFKRTKGDELKEIFQKLKEKFYTSKSCKDALYGVIFCNETIFETNILSFKDKLLNKISNDNTYFVTADRKSVDTFVIPNQEDIAIEFRKRNLDNQLLSEWLKETRKNYQGFDSCDKSLFYSNCKQCSDCADLCHLENQESEFWYLYYQLSTIRTQLHLYLYSSQTSTDICKVLEVANTYNEKLNALVRKVICANAQWMTSWLWYTGGEPKLNPFGRSDTTKLAQFLRSRITALDSDLKAYERAQSNVESIRYSQLFVGQLSREINYLKARLAQLPAEYAAYKKKIDELSVKTTLLNQLELFISNPKKVIWMPSYDASQKYKKLSEDYPDQLSEFDEMRPLVHNLYSNQKVMLTEDIKELTNITLLERETQDFFGGLPIATELSSKLQLFGIAEGFRQNITEGSPRIATCNEADVQNCLNDIEKTLSLASWLAEQTAPPKELTLQDGTDTTYYSTWVKPDEEKDKTGFKEVTYTITEQTKTSKAIVVRNEKYTKYELSTVAPSGGLVYHFKDRYASQYSDGKFSDVPFNRLDYVVGVKIYPFKTNIQYSHKAMKYYQLGKGYNYIRGNNWLNRLNFFVGLGTEKVFRNYYVGAGIDVFPWLQIQAGGNWYIQKRYTLQNGVLTDTQDKLANGGMYISATIPATLVTQLLKYINPF